MDRSIEDIEENNTPEYENEIIHLQEALQSSLFEVDQLKSSLNSAKDLIRQMEIELIKSQEDICYNKTRSSESSSGSSVSTSESDEPERKKRGLSKQVMERWDFYNRHKNDTEVLFALKTKFKSIGIDVVPWHLVKKKTDELFFKRLNMNTLPTRVL